MQSPRATAPGSLPGAEVVIVGLADLEAGRDTAEADAVLMAATRLRAAGAEVPPAANREPAAHRLSLVGSGPPRPTAP